MGQNDCGSGKLQGPLHHFAGINRRVVNGAFLLHLIFDELVFLVQKQYAKLFLVLESHGGAAVFEDSAPGRQQGAIDNPPFHQTRRGQASIPW